MSLGLVAGCLVVYGSGEGTGDAGADGFSGTDGDPSQATAGVSGIAGTGGTSSAGAAAGSSGSTAAAGAGGGPLPALPPVICGEPEGPVNTSQPDHVVGSGTPASCSETTLRTAVAAGGIITFDCGPAPVTINLSEPLVAPADRDTVLDGKHLVVLDGGGMTQLLRTYHPDFRVNDARLTVQRLVMQNGRDLGTGFQARNGSEICAWGYKEGGGGAIYTRDVNTYVWGVTFIGNRGPDVGPDVAGGAVYSLGSKEMVVVRSVFRDNRASNGGAIGALHTGLKLFNVIIENNHTTGLLANFANAKLANSNDCPVFNHAAQGGGGGLGGGVYLDGQYPGDTFCGVRMAGNVSADLGGAVFRSAYGSQSFTCDQCTFQSNSSPTGGGAVYLNNSTLTLTNSTFEDNDAGTGDGGGIKITGVTLLATNVSFTNNRAAWGGGLAHWGAGSGGYGTLTNVTYSDNTPNDRVSDQ